MRIFALFGRPEFLKAFHGWCTLLWIPFTVFALYMGWLHSVVFVSVMSMIALFLGSFSAWQAARTEQLQQDSIDEAK